MLQNVLPTLTSGHPARRYDPINNARFFTVCDYFLSLEGLLGFAEKYEFFKALDIDPTDIDKVRTDQEVAWRSLCTEFDALYIIGERLCFEVLGFEQHSPRRPQGKEQTCDFSATKNNETLYFEVKRKLGEVKNSCEDPEADLDVRHFEPDTLQDIESWLLGLDRRNARGEPMIPMVESARQKGADYLVVMVPGWELLETIVANCFRSYRCLSQTAQKHFFSNDPRLQDLRGVILLSEDGSFCVVQTTDSRTI